MSFFSGAGAIVSSARSRRKEAPWTASRRPLYPKSPWPQSREQRRGWKAQRPYRQCSKTRPNRQIAASKLAAVRCTGEACVADLDRTRERTWGFTALYSSLQLFTAWQKGRSTGKDRFCFCHARPAVLYQPSFSTRGMPLVWTPPASQ